MTKRIVIKIPLKGLSTKQTKVVVEAEGYNGVGCTAATEAFQKAIGSVESTVAKPEMYAGDQDQYIQQDA